MFQQLRRLLVLCLVLAFTLTLRPVAATNAENEETRSLAYVTQWDGGQFVIYDLSTLEFVGSVGLGRCYRVVYSRIRQAAYVACPNASAVIEVDVSAPEAPAISRIFTSIGNPAAMALADGDRRLFVVSRYTANVTMIRLDESPASRQQITVPAPVYDLQGMAASRDGKTVYVSDWVGFHAIDVQAAAFVRRYTFNHSDGFGPGELATSPDGRKMYATDGNAGTLAEVDLETAAFRWIYTSSQHGGGLAVSPDGTRAYMTHVNTGGWVSVIDLVSFRNLTPIRGLSGIYPTQATLSDDAGCLLVKNFYNLDIVRTGDAAKVGSIQPGGAEGAFATNGVPSSLCRTVQPSVIAWNPVALVYGQPLGAAQLNAASNAPGTFSYSMNAGTILNAGSHEICLTFTPSDPTAHEPAGLCRTITVSKATPIIRVSSIVVDHDGLPHAAPVVAAGPLGPVWPVHVQYQDAGGAISAVPPTQPGTYNVVAAYAGDANHNAAQATGTLRIREACSVEAARGLATLLGGNGLDSGIAIASTPAGELIVGGFTRSTDFPTTPGAEQRTLGGDADAFVTKFRADGSIAFSTYLGGQFYDGIEKIAVRPDGYIVLYGMTGSPDFRVTPDAMQAAFGGDLDAFVVVLSPEGDVKYSTFFGGAAGEGTGDMVLDPAGDVVFTGNSASALTTTLGAFSVAHRSNTIFVARLRLGISGPAALLGLATVGGDNVDQAYALAVDREGRIYVGGSTQSSDFPVTANALQTASGGFCRVNWPDCGDGYVTVLTPDLSNVVFSTYLGTDSDTNVRDLAVDASGGVYVVGRTYSGNWHFAAAPRVPFRGNQNGYLLKMTPFAPQVLQYVTFVGGTTDDVLNAVVTDDYGRVTAAGTAYSFDFPVTAGAPETLPVTGNAPNSPVIVDFTASGDIVYANFALAGRNHGEVARNGLVALPDGSDYLLGTSPSAAFPVSSCGYASRAVGYDAFVAHVPARRIRPTMTWNPADSIYGAPFGAMQFNATVDAPGRIDYSMPEGARPAAGVHEVTANFVPEDPDRYDAVSQTRSITVAPAALMVKANNLTREFGSDAPAFTVTVLGLVNGDSLATLAGELVFTTEPSPADSVGTYTVTPGGLSSADYLIRYAPATLTIVDTTAPQILSVTPSVAALWSPNHKMEEVSVSVLATDLSGTPACALTSVSANEPAIGAWVVKGPHTVDLRAERSGGGAGRIYTLTVSCADASGNTTTATATVSVAHDRRK